MRELHGLSTVLAIFGALALLVMLISTTDGARAFVLLALAAFLTLGPGLSLWQRMTRRRP